MEISVPCEPPGVPWPVAGRILLWRRGRRLMAGISDRLAVSSDHGQWSFLTNHARALLLIALEPDTRLRDLAAALDVTERTAFGIVDDLTEAGYLVKEREGRRNRYHIQEHLPVPGALRPHLTVGEVLALLVEARRQPRSRQSRTTVRRPAGTASPPARKPESVSPPGSLGPDRDESRRR